MLSIGKVIIKSGSQVFNNILIVLGVSVLWSILLVPSIFIFPVPTAVVYLLLTFYPLSLAAFAVLFKAVKGERVKIVRTFFSAFGKFYGRSFMLGLIYSLAIFIPVSTWWYYMNINDSYITFIFSIFQTYLCLMFLLSQVYTAGIVIAEDEKAFAAMNRSIKLFLWKPSYTFGLFIQVVSIIVLLSLTVVGFFLLFIGILGIFTLNSINNVLSYKRKLEEEESNLTDSESKLNNRNQHYIESH